ncbi:MAG: NADH-quinone oxidoreductase subunit L [Myxococcota bacterium]
MDLKEFVDFPLGLIPLFPLIGAAINGLAGAQLMRTFGPKVNHIIAICMPTLSFLVTVAAVSKLLGLPPEARALHHNLFPFIHVGFFDADMAFWFDPLSATLTVIITFVGTLIHIYSTGYMKGDPSYWRFFTYLNLFMAAMLMLALGDNFMVMFIGWEGVGLCSYLLIAFWYKEKANAVAGMKAFIVNRVGDFAFVLGLGLLFWGLMGDYQGNFAATSYRAGNYQGTMASVVDVEAEDLQREAHGAYSMGKDIMPSSVRFDNVRALVEADKAAWTENSPSAKTILGFPLIAVVCILFFIAATGKSAQIPLYVWLPDAMAGPTPVSALIHAATMVTAGVYMIARLNFLYALSPTAMTVVAGIGAITALFAATIGLFQFDIKKVLAYSTVSQLGYMFIGVGVGAYWAGIYHLLTHALFKACLFLGSGSVILGCHHEQDMRKMGGLKKFMPSTHWTYYIACMAITTAPVFLFANGFYSKDEILWKAFDAQHLLIPGWTLWLVGFIGAACTSFYMWRSYYMTFTGEYRGGHDDHTHGHDDHHHGGDPHESPRSMTWVLWTLAGLTFVSIALGFWPLLHITPLFEHWLDPVVGESMESLDWLSAKHGTFAGLGYQVWEYTLASASVVITLSAWLVARALYKDAKSPVPARILANPSPAIQMPYRLIFNKYYIDELYDFLIVRRTRQLSRLLYGFDQKVLDGLVHFAAFIGRTLGYIDGFIDTMIVDGMVNGVANGTAAIGRRLRQSQTGRIQTYLVGAAAGALALVFVNFLLF